MSTYLAPGSRDITISPRTPNPPPISKKLLGGASTWFDNAANTIR